MENVLEVTFENWEQEVLQSDILTVVDFWHHHCPWCAKFNPLLDEVAGEYKDKIKFVKFNVLANPDNRKVAVRYGIMGTPTLMFFCNKRSVGQTVGFMTKEDLRKTLADRLEKHINCIKQSTELKIQAGLGSLTIN